MYHFVCRTTSDKAFNLLSKPPLSRLMVSIHQTLADGECCMLVGGGGNGAGTGIADAAAPLSEGVPGVGYQAGAVAHSGRGARRRDGYGKDHTGMLSTRLRCCQYLPHSRLFTRRLGYHHHHDAMIPLL